jgi:hypothetical protein
VFSVVPPIGAIQPCNARVWAPPDIPLLKARKSARHSWESRNVQARVDGTLRHRLRLTPIRGNRDLTTKEPDRQMADQCQWDATELGALTRPLRVCMLNCSASGCLLESYVPLEMGTVATLEISVSGQVFNDAVQVVRCHAIAGSAGIHQIAARLLSTTPPYRGSLRYAMRSVTSPLASRSHRRRSRSGRQLRRSIIQMLCSEWITALKWLGRSAYGPTCRARAQNQDTDRGSCKIR